MRNTANDALCNLRCGVSRLVRAALIAGVPHTEVLTMVGVGIDAGARGLEPPMLAPRKPEIVKRAMKAASVALLVLLFVGSIGARGPLRITTSSLPSVIEGNSYSVQLHATGARKPYVWKIIRGSLPNGLSMNSSGLISGTVVGPANAFEFEVQVTSRANPASAAEVIFGHQ